MTISNGYIYIYNTSFFSLEGCFVKSHLEIAKLNAKWKLTSPSSFSFTQGTRKNDQIKNLIIKILNKSCSHTVVNIEVKSLLLTMKQEHLL